MRFIRLIPCIAAVAFFVGGFVTPSPCSSDEHDHGHDHGEPKSEHNDSRGHDHAPSKARKAPATHHDEHGHGHRAEDAHEEEAEKGPHGGRMLRDGVFALELSIAEGGASPRFRAYPFKTSEPFDPAATELTVQVVRFGGETETYSFAPDRDALSATAEVGEPHSFEVTVTSKFSGVEKIWTFESFEGRTQISKKALKSAGVTIEVAGPQRIDEFVSVFGKLAPNGDRVAHVFPRFGGIIREIRKRQGERVERGEVVAVVESNQNLQPYEIRSAIAGTVIERHATLGEFVSDDRQLFVIADLSELWAEFQIFRSDLGKAAIGQAVIIRTTDEAPEIRASVSYIAPVTHEATQSKLVRAVVSNPDGALRPGLFVSGDLVVAESSVPLAVKRTAIQQFQESDAVFGTDGTAFQALPVVLGRKDRTWVEIVQGLTAGQKYASDNSFVIRADIEKSGAAHEH
ncbi:MAG: efflux RND transporter periplasmic adaptor subunit [Deltaproteobacteria bacterium]|nr:efflux RND transporter periplasmic adaptor subunit [Deltaproteobacteria bacterium]